MRFANATIKVGRDVHDLHATSAVNSTKTLSGVCNGMKVFNRVRSTRLI
jgi:hypothetical protein